MPRPKGSKNLSKPSKRPYEEDGQKESKFSKTYSGVDDDPLQDETDLIQQFIEETERQTTDDDENNFCDEFEPAGTLTELKNVSPEKAKPNASQPLPTFAQIVTTGVNAIDNYTRVIYF
jgi:hypothetical protein